MINYIDHETKVKYIDALLAHDQNWQWFIDHIEENFDLNDIKTWSEFKSKNNLLHNVYANFIKILNVSNKELSFKNSLLSDIYNLSKFFLGICKFDECKANLLTKYGEILQIIIWVTKMQNQGNATEYLVDLRFFQQKNFWQLINMESVSLNEDLILIELDSIKIEGWKEPKKIARENIDQVLHPISIDYFDTYQNNFFSANAFNFQSLKHDICTWQEEYLLDMVGISINDKSIQPLMIIEGSITPNTSLWTLEVIQTMQDFFKNDIADFILDTISYLMYKRIPSNKVILQHCKLWSDYIKESKEFEITSCSSFYILSHLFKDKAFRTVNSSKDYINVIQDVQNFSQHKILEKLRNADFPISREQKQILRTYYELQYKKIDDFKNNYELLNYLKNEEITMSIDTTYFEKTKSLFREVLKDESIKGIRKVNFFHKYMVFLYNLNINKNDVDKRNIQNEMITIQELWQSEYYEEQLFEMHIFSHSTEISMSKIDSFNKTINNSPIFFAERCMVSREDEMCLVMESASENSLLYIFNAIEISPIYPLQGNNINFLRHDIDALLKKKVEKVKKENGYRFLNLLEDEIYVTAIHKHYEYKAQQYASIIKEEELYNEIMNNDTYNLIEYDNNLTIAHLTQLFPLLEIKIREVAQNLGVFPFKKSLSDFMIYKDPSSILREIITDIYKEVESFENIPDFLFIYNFMYNSNSLNIRNSCIHGRNYIEGNSLRFAFRITILAISMVNSRLYLLKEQVSQSKTLPKQQDS
ncbi:MAG: hypothetical protein WBA84_11075 [Carnobacterium sp.]|uniref:hypothetical protein n=1 Tax=Carnobacterium sp. TaxID=48221 RepID=UPI003C794957